MTETRIRPAVERDVELAYALFRRSIYDYLYRVGLATAEEARTPPIASAWLRQGDWVRHFWQTAAENWVAEGPDGQLQGWALSVLRGGHLELTFFFVDPVARVNGLGRRLLERAFAARPETARTIMATQDAPALALYLRAGVDFVTTSFDIAVRAAPAAPVTDLTFHPIDPAAGDIALVAAMEDRILGLRREADLAFLAGNRPGWIAPRGQEPAGYAFGAQPYPPGVTDFPPTCGPMAALDPADLPALIDHVLDSVTPGQEVSLGVPMSNRVAVSHLLGKGGKIDPFYLAVLSSQKGLQLDRYIHTSPSFIL
jgi:GNAT superfamily N-acetyltransferase